MPLREAASACTQRMMAKKNVIGVGEGDNEVVVLVTKKEPLEDLNHLDVVDASVADPVTFEHHYNTKVIEVGDVKPLGLRPGASVGVNGFFHTGTCGCLVMHNGEMAILSNNHVIAATNQAVIGTGVIHPGPADGRPVEVAKLADYKHIEMSEHAHNRLDAAVADVIDPRSVVANDAIVEPLSHVSVGQRVIKSGRTTGTTTGDVLALNTTVTVNFGELGLARFTGQVVTTSMLEPGDSGSIGRSEDGNPFGLGFAGSSSASFYNLIQEVFEEFDLSLPNLPEADEPPTEPEPEPEKSCWLSRFWGRAGRCLLIPLRWLLWK